MPSKSNFYSVIKGKIKNDINYLFQKNSWTELILESDNASLLIYGLVAYHPDNVKIIKNLFDGLESAYKFEFYDNYKIVEHTQNSM